MKFKVGDDVVGKKVSLLGKRGRIIAIDTSGRSVKNRVLWSDLTEGDYFSKALGVNNEGADLTAPLETPNEAPNLTQASSRSRTSTDEDEEDEESDSEESNSDSDPDIEFGDREGTNELHPEDGLPEVNPLINAPNEPP